MVAAGWLWLGPPGGCFAAPLPRPWSPPDAESPSPLGGRRRRRRGQRRRRLGEARQGGSHPARQSARRALEACPLRRARRNCSASPAVISPRSHVMWWRWRRQRRRREGVGAGVCVSECVTARVAADGCLVESEPRQFPHSVERAGTRAGGGGIHTRTHPSSALLRGRRAEPPIMSTVQCFHGNRLAPCREASTGYTSSPRQRRKA